MTPKLVNSRYVADKLKISTGGVLGLIERGLLKDQQPRVEGSKRHYPRFLKEDIATLKETYKPRKQKYPLLEAAKNGNQVPVVVAPVVVTETPSNRLERIEAKLDQLLKIWG